MRRVACVAIALACAGIARAQGTCVVVDRHDAVPSGRSLDDVKRDALHGAIAEAVRRVAGVRVQGTQSMSASDSAGHAVTRYDEAIRLDAEGRATSWTVLRDGWKTAKGASAPVSYELSLRVCVERETGAADPSFAVRLATNAERLLVRSDTAARNDELVARVTATRDASLTVVLIAGDSVFVLAPSAYLAAPDARAGEAVEVPDASLRGAGLRFRAALPPGVAARDEIVAVIATRRPVPLPSRAGAGSARDTGVLTLAEFNRWLVGIPLDLRAVAQAAVRVERAR